MVATLFSKRTLTGIYLLVFFTASRALATSDGVWSRLDMPISVSYDVSALGNKGIGLDYRAMEALSVEILPGWQVSNFLVGVDFVYQLQGQLTPLAKAGGTNLRGMGWYLGIGTNYTAKKNWAFQGAINFLGAYSFTRQTDQAFDAGLKNPLGIRLKAQYLPFESIPVSVDLNLQYEHYLSVDVASRSYHDAANQWFAGLGLTYRFRNPRVVARPTNLARPPRIARHERAEKASPVVPIEIPMPVLEPRPAQPTEEVAPPSTPPKDENARMPADLGEFKHTDTGVMVSLEGQTFAPASAALNPNMIIAIEKLAVYISKRPSHKVRIEGYSDTSGNAAKNLKLSKNRAQAIRDVLLRQGVSAEIVSAEGFGAAKPIADNKTAEGRQRNRRVEIYLDDN